MRVRDILKNERDITKTDLFGLLSSALCLSKEQLMVRPEHELQADQENRLECLLEERRRGRPLAYITGEREFFSRSFVVDHQVLIPRPETETLVEEALCIISSRPERGRRMLDIGTGSGAIGITLAKETGKHVTCLDISPDALDVARANALRLGAIDLIDLVCCDLLSGFADRARFDVIVANLPYISAEEWPALMPDVRLFEPQLALWGGGNGLDVYSRLVPEIRGHLSFDGHILCEIGSSEQAEVLSELFRGIGLSVRTKKDLAGRDRVVVGSCKSL